MKVIRYIASWFEVGPSGVSEARYKAGQCYPVTEETQRHVVTGAAEEIEASEEVQLAMEAAAKVKADAEAAPAATSPDVAPVAETTPATPAPEAAAVAKSKK